MQGLLLCVLKKRLKIQKQLKDFEIITELRDNQTFTSNNEILKNELPLMIDDLSIEIEASLEDLYKDDSDTRVIYLEDEKIKNAKVGNEEVAVNRCCENIYIKTPMINNELVNRTTINTAQTRKARINIINAILNNEIDDEFARGSNQEATVYRSLFQVTHIIDDSSEKDEALTEILEKINQYIDECSDRKVGMTSLITKLTSAPYGMRLGVIPFYFAYIIANRHEDIVTYFADKEIQLTADIIVNMCEHPEDYAIYVSKEDIQKEKYISELNLLFQVADNRNLSTNRIKDIFICMQRWFRALPQVSRNLLNIDKYIGSDIKITAMKAIKKSLQKIEFNPFETLFVDYPKIFNTNNLEETYQFIDECKTYYDDYFDWIQEEIVEIIYTALGGRRKKDLYHCLKDWYESQSKRSKQGLYSGRITNFMSAIEMLDVYSDTEIAVKIAKAVSDVYVENWNTGSIEDFKNDLNCIMEEIGSIKDEASTGEMTLSFTRRNGEPFEKTYIHADESTGSVLRNIIEDALEEYDDLSVNDRVSILLEMIEKITK